ncbi:hypothetical protein ECPA3_5852, partial [Escherichia coli PA3]
MRALSASSGSTPSFSSIHASVSSNIFAGVRTSCNAPPRTLP